LGDCVELSVNNLKKIGSIPSGAVLIDGSGSGSSESSVLRDRQTLAADGICIIGIGFDKKTGAITSGPDIATRGLLYSEELIDFMDEAKMAVLDSIKNNNINLSKGDAGEIRNTIRKDVQNFFNKVVKRRPMVITMLQGS